MRRWFHHQLFSCRSDFKETRPRLSFLFKSYNSNKVCVSRFCFATPGEGHKPSSKAYVAESEFTLLGILLKILIVHFYRFSKQLTDGRRNNKLCIFQTLLSKRSSVQMLINSLSRPCVNQSELPKHSRKSLDLRSLCIVLMYKLH